MKENTIMLSIEQMRQIARYEITFKDLIDGSEHEEGNIICSGVYVFTLDDLYHTVKALKENDPTVKEFGEDWFYPITKLSAAFDLERACGYAEGGEDVPEALKGYPELRVTDSDYFKMVWWNLEDAWENYDDEEGFLRFSILMASPHASNGIFRTKESRSRSGYFSKRR